MMMKRRRAFQRIGVTDVHPLNKMDTVELDRSRPFGLTRERGSARHPKALVGFFLIMTLFLCSACASMKGPKTSAAHTARKSSPEASSAVVIPEEETTRVPAEKPQEISLPEYKPEKAQKDLPLKEPIDPTKLVHSDTPVLINADSMPLSSFIVYAVGDTLKVTYVLDEPVMNMKNPVTL